MKNKTSLLLFALPLLALPFFACDSTQASTVAGSVERATFPSAVTSVVAVAADGAETSVDLDELGGFQLALASDTSYRLMLETADGRLPVAARAVGFRFGTVFQIASDGAAVHIGALRHRALDSSATAVAESCVDWLTSTAGLPCIQEEAPVECRGAAGGRHDEEPGAHHHNGHHSHHDSVCATLTSDTASSSSSSSGGGLNGSGGSGGTGDAGGSGGTGDAGGAAAAGGSGGTGGAGGAVSGGEGLGLGDSLIQGSAAAIPQSAIPAVIACRAKGC